MAWRPSRYDEGPDRLRSRAADADARDQLEASMVLEYTFGAGSVAFSQEVWSKIGRDLHSDCRAMVRSNRQGGRSVNGKMPWVAVACSIIPALMAGGVLAEDSAAVARGKTLYTQTCSVCHGPDGKGVPSLGKDLVNSKFVAGQTDDQLLEYVQKGRAANDPLNTTGIAMPARAGNPSLTDDQIRDIIAYIRTIVTK